MSKASGDGADGARETIRVFLLDDHEVVRRGLRDLLDAEADVEVIGDAGTAESGMNRMLVLKPDVALLDVRLPDGDGVTVCRDIRSALPGTACLMLTGYGDDQALLGAIMAGAAGYVMKQASAEELVGAVRAVAGRPVHPRRRCRHPGDAAAARRVSRRPVRSLLVGPGEAGARPDRDGLTNRQIAERMFLSEKTAKNYVSAVLGKLGMQRQSQAAALAARLAIPGELMRLWRIYQRAHERPVGFEWLAIVQQGRERRVGGVTGQVVIVAGVMVSGPPPIMAERVHDRQMMGLARVWASARKGGRRGRTSRSA